MGHCGSWDDVPSAVVQKVACRTPGFGGWQEERRWTHCADAAAFLGRAERREVEERWRDAVPALKQEAELFEPRTPTRGGRMSPQKSRRRASSSSRVHVVRAQVKVHELSKAGTSI